MARERIKFGASFKGEVWTGRRESMERGGTGVPWPSSYNTDLESSELVYGGESGLMRIEGSWSDSGPAGETIPSISSVLSSMAVKRPTGSKLPSLDLVRSSRSEVGTTVGVASRW